MVIVARRNHAANCAILMSGILAPSVCFHRATEEKAVKTFIVVLASALYLATTGTVQAHGDDKPKHGGVMGRGDDSASVELVMEEGVVTLYVDEHASDIPIPTEGARGTLSVAGPGRPPQEAKLIPAGNNTLTASGLKPIAGDRLRAHIILPSGVELSLIFSFR
jgi:hypothetical protein